MMIRESPIGRVMTCSQPACGNIFKPSGPIGPLMTDDGFIMNQARGAGWLVPSLEFALCPHHAHGVLGKETANERDQRRDHMDDHL